MTLIKRYYIPTYIFAAYILPRSKNFLGIGTHLLRKNSQTGTLLVGWILIDSESAYLVYPVYHNYLMHLRLGPDGREVGNGQRSNVVVRSDQPCLLCTPQLTSL